MLTRVLARTHTDIKKTENTFFNWTSFLLVIPGDNRYFGSIAAIAQIKFCVCDLRIVSLLYTIIIFEINKHNNVNYKNLENDI